MVSQRLQRQVDRLLDEPDQAITKEDRSTVNRRNRAALAIDPKNSLPGRGYSFIRGFGHRGPRDRHSSNSADARRSPIHGD